MEGCSSHALYAKWKAGLPIGTEYNKYHKRPKQRHNRSLRNMARREYESSHGNLSSAIDVDHRRPLSKGGSNARGNLRALSRTANRSFKRTKSGGMK